MSLDRDRLLAIFEQELDERRRDLERDLIELETAPSAERQSELIRELFRSAHSLKGAAASAGVREVASVASALEDALSKMRDAEAPVDRAALTRLFEDLDQVTADSTATSGDPLTEAVSVERDTGTSAAEASTSAATPRRGVAPPTVERRPMPGRVRLSAGDIDAALSAAGEMRLAVQRLVDLPSRVTEAVTTAQRVRGSWQTLRTALPDAAVDSDVRLTADRLGRHLDRLVTQLKGIDRVTKDHERQLERAEAEVNRTVGRLGLVSFRDVCDGLDRIVRDIAAASGKEAQVRVVGGDVELDRTVAATLRDPLAHLVRNAVDHGIEQPQRRQARGKDPVGIVQITADVNAGQVVVRVRDDGAGVHPAAVAAAARARGLDATSDLDSALSLIFDPGVSTAGRVTEVSGRGVGLDAVRGHVEMVGGTVSISSQAGIGTQVEMTLPLTLSTIRAVIVRTAGEVVALPATAIDRTLRVAEDAVVLIEGVETIPVDEHAIRLVDLGWLLGFSPSPTPTYRDGKAEAVLVRTAGEQAALGVESCLSEHDITLRAPGRRLRDVPGLLGLTVLRDGSAALVLNPATWVRQAVAAASAARDRPARDTARRPRIILAEDTLTTRTLERSILEAAGYDVTVAVDGSEAWRLLQRGGADVVVSDVDMPNMDGFALCEAIRASERFANLPVVLVTSLADERSRQRGLEAGANAYVVKSDFDQAALIETIERLL